MIPNSLKNIAAELYPKLPVWAQNSMCSFYGLQERGVRFGHEFDNFMRKLDCLEWEDRFTIEEYQLQQINFLLEQAKQNVPFYRESNDYPDKVTSLKEFSCLPVLEKDVFRRNPNAFLSEKFTKKELFKYSTSGTSGKPVNFYRSRKSIASQWAVWSRHKQRFNVNFNDYHALFTGKPIVPAAQSKAPYWRLNRPGRQLIFGMLHTSEKAIRAIINKLEKEDIQFYTGYPSIIYQIAISALNLGLVLKNGPKVIFVGAEPLYDYQRMAIENCFNAQVTDQYGTSEGLANASKCEKGNYHVDFEFGHLEIMSDGLNKDQAIGEILMTGFTNHAMPLIRYMIGDRGKLSNAKCGCGRESRILEELSGRSEDYVLTPEGNRITRLDYIFKGVIGIEEAQIRQIKEGEIIIILVTNNSYDQVEEHKIRQTIKKYISESITVYFKFVEEIPRTSSGKFRAVVNKLNLPN